MRFDSLAPPEPDLPALLPQMAALRARVGRDDAATVIARWASLRAPVYTWLSWVNLRHRLDTRDPEVSAWKRRSDALDASWEQEEIALEAALLALPEDELEAAVAAQAVAKWSSAVAAVNPAIREERERENSLVAEYVKLTAAGAFEVDGRSYDLSTIAGPATSPERGVRERAARALYGWMDGARPELDRIYDELTALRDGMARTLGHRDFVQTGYLRMNRVDYGPEDVARFRAAVIEHIVPLGQAIRDRQAQRLGIDRVMLWDEDVLEADGNAQPVPVPEMLAAGKRAFRRLDGRIADFYERLVDDGWIDLPARPGKAPGGFCTYLDTARQPFVFCNASGVQRDVRTLVHEVGHAFQKQASAHIVLPELLHGTSDAAEIHSMSLEFLAWPVMDAWFPGDADRFRRGHLANAVLFLPYGLLVDEFQHEVYAAPDCGPAARHGMWAELERAWLPWRDCGDLPHVAQGGLWQKQRHIYARPFYYVDYCLAQTVALQFWALAQNDPADAMERYVALCGRGGSLPFQSLVRTTGLASPLDDGAVAGVAETVARALDL